MGRKVKCYSNELCHHGTIGMKWGVWNDETRARYEGRKTILNSASDAAKKTSKLGNKHSKNRNSNSYEKARASGEASKMSEQELRSAINRMNLEKQYVDLKTKDIQSGREKVFDLLDDVGDVLAIGASALSIYIAFRTLKAQS